MSKRPAKRPVKRKPTKKKKNSYNRYLNKLQKNVGEGDVPLYRWYRNVGTAHLNKKLTKKEFRKLLKEGEDYEV